MRQVPIRAVLHDRGRLARVALFHFIDGTAPLA
jgi:hypothetical protein